jgi:hypothetical protein
MDSDKRTTMKKVSGAALAIAAAGLFLGGAASTVSAAEAGKIHCVGLNACKGTSDCKTATNACKGKNECKGRGFLAMSEKDCKAKGGTIEKS